MSNSLALTKNIPSFHKYSRFMLRNNSLKGSRNSEYSINPGLNEKLGPLHTMFFSSSVNSYEEK